MPDADLRKRIWRALGGPGMLLAGGAVAGLWRATKRGSRLVVDVEPVGRLGKAKGRGRGRGERLAPFRGATTVSVTWG